MRRIANVSEFHGAGLNILKPCTVKMGDEIADPKIVPNLAVIGPPSQHWQLLLGLRGRKFLIKLREIVPGQFDLD